MTAVRSTADGLPPLDELDPVAIRIAHEAQQRAALADAVGRLLGLDALAGEVGERLVHVGDGDRDVVVARAELVLGDAVVVRELQARAVAGQPHEDVDRLVADRLAAELLEAERLVERHRAVDVADPLTVVEELAHGIWGLDRPSGPGVRGRSPLGMSTVAAMNPHSTLSLMVLART